MTARKILMAHQPTFLAHWLTITVLESSKFYVDNSVYGDKDKREREKWKYVLFSKPTT